MPTRLGADRGRRKSNRSGRSRRGRGASRAQFEHWGPLTGFASAEAYGAFLREAAGSTHLPKVLVATCSGEFLGSVNLLAAEMATHRHLTPWMGQLFVAPGRRGDGLGGVLLRAAAAHAADLGYDRLYLFTSGTLPRYYRARGWADVEEAHYLGSTRTIMRLDLRHGVGASAAG